MGEGHAVAYTGGDKAKIQQKHLENRQRLIDEGKVPTPDGMTTRIDHVIITDHPSAINVAVQIA